MTEPVDPQQKFLERMRLAWQHDVIKDRPQLAGILASSDATPQDIARIGTLIGSLDIQNRLRLMQGSGATRPLTAEEGDLLAAANAPDKPVQTPTYEQAAAADTDLPWWQDLSNWYIENFYGVDPSDPNLKDAVLSQGITSPANKALGWGFEQVAKLPGFAYRLSQDTGVISPANAANFAQRQVTDAQEKIAQGYDPNSLLDHIAFRWNGGEQTYDNLAPLYEKYDANDVNLARAVNREEGGLLGFRMKLQDQYAEAYAAGDTATMAALTEQINRLDNPEFIEGAFAAVDRSHRSVGRELARGVLPEDWQDDAQFTALSGSVDALWLFTVDPFLAAGAGVKSAQIAKWGLDSVNSTRIYHQLGLTDPLTGTAAPARYLGKNNRVRGIENFIDETTAWRAAMDEGDTNLAAAIYTRAKIAHPDLAPLWQEFNGFVPAIGVAERNVPGKVEKFVDGLGIVAPYGGVRTKPIQSVEDFAEWAVGRWGLMRMANGLPAQEFPMLPGKMGIVASVRAERAFKRTLNGGDDAALRGDTLIDFNKAEDAVVTPAEELMEKAAIERGQQLFDQARITKSGVKVAAMKWEAAKRRLSTLLEESRVLNFNAGADAKVVEQFAKIYMPKWEAARLASMWEHGSPATRRTLAKAMLRQTFEASGLSRSAVGREFVERFINDTIDGASKRRYGFGNSDVITDGYQGARRAGLYPSQAADVIELPPFSELRRLAAKAAVMGYDPNLATFGLNKASIAKIGRRPIRATRFWLFSSEGMERFFGLVKLGWIANYANAARSIIDEYGGLFLTKQTHRLRRGRQTMRDANLNNKLQAGRRFVTVTNSRIPRKLRAGIRTIDDAIRAVHQGKIESLGKQFDEQRAVFAKELDDEMIQAELGDALGGRIIADASEHVGLGAEYAEQAHKAGLPLQRWEYQGHRLIDRDGGGGLSALSDNYGQRFLAPRMLPRVREDVKENIRDWDFDRRWDEYEAALVKYEEGLEAGKKGLKEPEAPEPAARVTVDMARRYHELHPEEKSPFVFRDAKDSPANGVLAYIMWHKAINDPEFAAQLDADTRWLMEQFYPNARLPREAQAGAMSLDEFEATAETLYHGTAREFSKFDPKPELSNYGHRRNLGVYFSHDPKVANGFAWANAGVEQFPDDAASFYDDIIMVPERYGIAPELAERLRTVRMEAESLADQARRNPDSVVAAKPAASAGADPGPSIRPNAGSLVVIQDRTGGDTVYRLGLASKVSRGLVKSVKYGELDNVPVDGQKIDVMVIGDQNTIDIASMFDNGQGMPKIAPSYKDMREVREVLSRFRTGDPGDVVGALSGKPRGKKAPQAPAIVPQSSMQELPESPSAVWQHEPNWVDEVVGGAEKYASLQQLYKTQGKLAPLNEAPSGRRGALRVIEHNFGIKLDPEDYLLNKAITDTSRGSNGRFVEELQGQVNRELREKYNLEHSDKVPAATVKPGDWILLTWEKTDKESLLKADFTHPHAEGRATGYSEHFFAAKVDKVENGRLYVSQTDLAGTRHINAKDKSVPVRGAVYRMRTEEPVAAPAADNVVEQTAKEAANAAGKELIAVEAEILKTYLAHRIAKGARVKLDYDSTNVKTNKRTQITRTFDKPEQLDEVDPEVFNEPYFFTLVKKGWNPRVIETKVYGKTADLRDKKNIPEDLKAALDEEGVWRPWKDISKIGYTYAHENSKALVDWMRANGYGKVRVPDAGESGWESYLALPEMIAFGRDPVAEFASKADEAVAANPPTPDDLANLLRDPRYAEMRRELEHYNVDAKGNRIAPDDEKALDEAIVRMVPKYIEDITNAVTGRNGKIHPGLADMLIRGEVPDAAELRAFGQDALPPMAIAAQYGVPANAVDGWIQGATKTMTKAYDVLVTTPIRAFLRAPLYTDMYVTARLRTKQMADNLVETHGWDREIADEWAKATARKQAMIETLKYVDNPRVASQFSAMNRGWWSFFRAQEDWLRRYGRAIKANPEAIRKAQLAVYGGEEAGIIDRDDAGNWMLTYPGSGAVVEAIMQVGNKLGWIDDAALIPQQPDFKTRLTFLSPSINNPFGYSSTPMVSLPMRFVTAIAPGGEMIDSYLDRLVNGEVGAGREWYEQLLPPPILRLMQLGDYDNTTGSTVGSAMATAAMYMALNGKLDDYADTPDDRARLITDLQQVAMTILATRQLFAFAAPGAPSMPRAGEEGEMADSALSYQDAGIMTANEEYRAMLAQMGPAAAIDLWVKLHPEKAAFAYAGKTTANAPNAITTSTLDAAYFVNNNRDFFSGEYRSIAPYFMPEDAGEFSQVAWNTLLRLEVRQHKDLDTFLIDLVTANGVSEYYNKRDASDEAIRQARMAGNRPQVAQLEDEWKAEKDRLMVKYPTLDDWFALGPQRDRARQDRLEVMRKLAEDPQAPAYIQPQLAGITEMLNVHAVYEQRYEALGTSQSARTRAERSNLRSEYHDAMKQIVGEYPTLGDVYSGVFRLLVEEE